MSGTFHGSIALGDVHIAANWAYANAAARAGATGFLAADVGKLARQLDDNSLWMLTATTPTWVRVSDDPAAFARANHTGTQLAATISNFDTQVRTSRLDQLAAPTGPVPLNGQKLTGVADPTVSQDAATKAYVDALIQGIRWKAPVRAASTANVSLTAPGATLDGITLASGDRILLKDQTAAADNGLYVWTGASATLTRATDADTALEILQAATFVMEGTANSDRLYVNTVNAPVTLGTTALTFVTFSSAVGSLLAANNLSDLGSAATARTNLGLGTAAVVNVPASGDAASGEAVKGSDTRLTNSRTPAAHKATHEVGGSDPFTGIVPGGAFAAAGLTGATSGARLVGGTAASAPASGTFAALDFIITAAGSMYICTVGGSPGTWVQVSGGGGGMTNPMTTAGDIIVGGTSGTPARLAKGTDGYVLTMDPATHLPVWAAVASSGGMTNPFTTSGDLMYALGVPKTLVSDTAVHGATASANSTFSGFPASNAIDGSDSTRWASNNTGATGTYLRIDLGTTPRTIGSWRYLTGNFGGGLEMPTALALQYSNDLSTWTTADTLTTGTYTGLERTLGTPVLARYWQIISTGTGGNFSALALDLFNIAVLTPTALPIGANKKVLGSDGAAPLWIDDGKPTGLTGATAATRFVGGTASGPPTSGTFAVGDFVVTQAGGLYICTIAGTPGTWAGSGGAVNVGGMVPLYDVTLAADAASIDVAAGLAGYRDLVIAFDGQSSVATGTGLRLRLNGDTAANYDYEQLSAYLGAGAATASFLAQTSAYIGDLTDVAATSGEPTSLEITLPNCNQATIPKAYRVTGAASNGTSNGTPNIIRQAQGWWRGTAAITQVTIFPVSGNIKAGARLTIWGRSAAIQQIAAGGALYEYVVPVAQASIVVPIPAGYKDLEIVFSLRGDAAAGNVNLLGQVNGDTGSNYDTAYEANNATPGAFSISQSLGATTIPLGYIAAATAPAGVQGAGRISLPNYESTSFNRQLRVLMGLKNSTSNGGINLFRAEAWWRSSAAITSLTLSLSSGNFAAGSVVRVYARGGVIVGGLDQGARVTRATNQNLGAATFTPISWSGTDDYDTIAAWSSGTPTRLTAVAAGKYSFKGYAILNGTDVRYLKLRKNGTTDLVKVWTANVAAQMALLLDWEGRLAAGDYLEVLGYLTAGGNTSSDLDATTQVQPWATLRKVA